MTTTATKLTGQVLLDYIDANPLQSHTQNCRGAGYFKVLDDGSTGCDYIAFFEAVLEARNEVKQELNGDWYDSLTEQDQELYDAIEEMCPEFTKLSGDMCQEFMDELSDLGITTAQQFEDAYYFQTDEYKPEAHFAEYVTTEVNCVDLPTYLVIDWQSTWDSELSYDFSTIEFDGETYFFNNNF